MPRLPGMLSWPRTARTTNDPLRSIPLTAVASTKAGPTAVCAAPFCVLLALQDGVGGAFIVGTAMSGLLLNGSFVVLAVRGQESMPGSLGMVSGLMLGLSIGLGGLAVTPMAILAERVGIEPVFVAAGGLAIVCALLMRAVPSPPAHLEAVAVAHAG